MNLDKNTDIVVWMYSVGRTADGAESEMNENLVNLNTLGWGLKGMRPFRWLQFDDWVACNSPPSQGVEHEMRL